MKFILYAFLVLFGAFCQIRLPKHLSDNMVLQRHEPVLIWGWSSPNEKINLSFENIKYKTKASAQGEWQIQLPPHKAGGPFEIKINEKNIKNILFGDVWFCSGQSNMVLNMERVKERFPNEIAEANYPEIRNLFVPTATDLVAPNKEVLNLSWKPISGPAILEMGAVSFFFAKEIYEKYKVPIGIINSSVGGTPIEAWISETGHAGFGENLSKIKKNKDTSFVNTTNRLARASQSPFVSKDQGFLDTIKWYDMAYLPKGWRNINIPGYWEDQGLKDLNGVVWYRKEVVIPNDLNLENAKIYMGRIIDADHIYVNGTQIGNITYQYPPRRYTIPPGILRPGKNVVVIRVSNTAAKGGFVPDKPYFMYVGGRNIDLKGEWQYKVGEVFEPQSSAPLPMIVAQNQPSALFNAMVAPFTKTKIRGVLWYQGESNSTKPNEYKRLLPALIDDWRNQFKNPILPFVVAQLPNFMDINYIPSESQWAEMREAQFGALAIKNTGVSVNIDAGEWNDIHPLDKKTVGSRMAKWARKLAYAEELVYSGPIFVKSEISEDQIILHFESIGSGLISSDGEALNWFAIAGEDKKFVWANAHISGDRVIVNSPNVKTPKYVRYAWADNPAGCNLYNKEGLPASPFRTDVD